jgi:hypothetical protein
VVFQGLEVQILGSLFANGGAGAAGAERNVQVGDSGDNGKASSAVANGGTALSGSGDGGDGATQTSSPTVGLAATTGAPGGGGGSTGFFRVVVPSGVTPSLDPAAASPVLSLTESTSTR